MIYIFINILTWLGIGSLIDQFILKKSYVSEMKSIIGLSISIVLVLIFNLYFLISLKIICTLITTVGILATFYFIFRGIIKIKIADPLICYSIIFGVVFELMDVFYNVKYTPHTWDTFSTYLTNTIIIYNSDFIHSPEYANKMLNSNYLPGWYIILLMPNYLLGDSLSIEHFHLANLSVSIIFISLIYNFLNQYSKNAKPEKIHIFLIILSILGIGVTLIENQIYLEPIQITVGSILLLLILMMSQSNKENLMKWFYVIASTTMLLFLIKESSVVWSPIIILSISIIMFNWKLLPFQKNQIELLTLSKLILLGSFVILSQSIWFLGIAASTNTLSAFNQILFEGLFTEYSIKIATLMFKKLFLDLTISNILFYLIVIVGIIITFTKKEFIDWIIPLIFLSIIPIFFISMLIAYLTKFGEEEASKLASFDRYLSIYINPTLFIFSLIIIMKYNLIEKESNKIFKKFQYFSMVFLAVFKYDHMHHMNDRKYVENISYFDFRMESLFIQKTVEILHKTSTPAKILFIPNQVFSGQYEIYQNSTWRWYYKGRFSKFPDYYLISNLNLENILESDLIWIRDAERRKHLKKIATENKIEVNCEKKAAQIFRYQNNVLNCIKYDVEHFNNKSLLFQIKKIVYKSKILTETFKILRKGMAQLRSTKEVIS